MSNQNYVKSLSILGENTNLFSQGNKYIIPLYQRAFEWKEDQTSQLIDDLNDFEANNYHLGSLVVAQREQHDQNQNALYEVIDGQQRLTALFLTLNVLRLLLKDQSCSNCLILNSAPTYECRISSKITFEKLLKLEINATEISDRLIEIQEKLKKLQSSNSEKENDIEKCDENMISQSINIALKINEISRASPNKLEAIAKFADKLKKVKLYLIEVPKHTDLNRYFEIMNTRGEQLEPTDIIKAKFMGLISTEEKRSFFHQVWEACADMTGYVQMHLPKATYRKILFELDANNSNESDSRRLNLILKANNLNCIIDDETVNELNKTTNSDKKDGNNQQVQDIEKELSINELLAQGPIPDFTIDGKTNGDKDARFESIIDFKYFLLHVLKIFVISKTNMQNLSDLYNTTELEIKQLLDDKRLIKQYESAIDYLIKDEKENTSLKEQLSFKFLSCLLNCRFILDKYFIKREFSSEDLIGKWSLKTLHLSNNDKQSPYYKNTFSEEINNQILKLQSCFRVSYTSPKVMHWITELLLHIYQSRNDVNNVDSNTIKEKCVTLARNAVKNDYLNREDKESSLQKIGLGVDTPHIVLNYLDYLFWDKLKHDSNKEFISNLKLESFDPQSLIKDFDFEFRNSVEHWYPQNPSGGTFKEFLNEDGLNSLGNLCLVPSRINAKFSNLSPISKLKTYQHEVNEGSLKLRIMAKMAEKLNDEKLWINSETNNANCKLLNDISFNLLKDDCQNIN